MEHGKWKTGNPQLVTMLRLDVNMVRLSFLKLWRYMLHVKVTFEAEDDCDHWGLQDFASISWENVVLGRSQQGIGDMRLATHGPLPPPVLRIEHTNLIIMCGYPAPKIIPPITHVRPAVKNCSLSDTDSFSDGNGQNDHARCFETTRIKMSFDRGAVAYAYHIQVPQQHPDLDTPCYLHPARRNKMYNAKQR